MEKQDILDQRDLMIIYLLQQDSRMSLSDLAQSLELTPAAISYRLKKLIEQRVILKFSILLNHSILTPNYQSYLVNLNVNSKSEMEELKITLLNSGFVDRLIHVADIWSLVVITLPLSGQNLKDLTSLLQTDTVNQFQIKPILNDQADFERDLIGENISNIYCPVCQKTVKGEGVISNVGSKNFAFCCRECRDQFSIIFTNLSNQS